jgi:hypothetical protein
MVFIATFLVCYLVYMLTPVAGPYYEYARPVGEFDTGPPDWCTRPYPREAHMVLHSIITRAAATVAATPERGW